MGISIVNGDNSIFFKESIEFICLELISTKLTYFILMPHSCQLVVISNFVRDNIIWVYRIYIYTFGALGNLEQILLEYPNYTIQRELVVGKVELDWYA